MRSPIGRNDDNFRAHERLDDPWVNLLYFLRITSPKPEETMTLKAALPPILLLAAFLGTPSIANSAQITFEKHRIDVTVDPITHSAHLSDQATVTIAPGWNSFLLRACSWLERRLNT